MYQKAMCQPHGEHAKYGFRDPQNGYFCSSLHTSKFHGRYTFFLCAVRHFITNVNEGLSCQLSYHCIEKGGEIKRPTKFLDLVTCDFVYENTL